ncbi:DUF6029 family protein [Aureivirga marina]|uniref:DUF6029 family protein n=1 Tax=Aureivirga marina TaxID=1182451 RepID=UPI0018CBEB7B|nr:DUF6029 family protein [Aureivirga marina]
MNLKLKQLIPACILGISTLTTAQELGNISGSFESTTQHYNNDDAIGANFDNVDKWGSNNYLKLDYNYDNIYAGLQYEAYVPALYGFDPDGSFEGEAVASYYLAYEKEKFGVRGGFIYDQFGSGLIFRSWEDRQIGINNAVKGVRAYINFDDILNVKTVYGRQRKNLKETGTGVVRGVDAEVNLNNLTKLNGKWKFNVGASVVDRYEGGYSGPIEDFPSNVTAYSLRFNATNGSIYFDAEYVGKSKDAYVTLEPQIEVTDFFFDGNAFLANLGYSRKGFGINATFRRMQFMNFRSERIAQNNSLIVNYVPALTKQHDYSLTNIYVYAAQSNFILSKKHAVTGEIGGQIDIYYTIPKGTFLGGKYGTKIAINASQWNGLVNNGFLRFEDNKLVEADVDNELLKLGERYFQDINIEIYKKWNRKWKSTVAFLNGYYNNTVLKGGPGSGGVVKTQIAVADVTYNFTRRSALRVEGQHMWADDSTGDWAAATVEYTFAPKWSIYAADMYNYGNKKPEGSNEPDNQFQVHYYNFGMSYTKGSTRFAASYGRQRAGLLCVGGVCRVVPASTGLTLTLNTTF